MKPPGHHTFRVLKSVQPDQWLMIRAESELGATQIRPELDAHSYSGQDLVFSGEVTSLWGPKGATTFGNNTFYIVRIWLNTPPRPKLLASVSKMYCPVSVGKARIGACISDARRTLKAVEQPASHTNVPPMDVSYHPEMSKPGRPVQRLVIEALYRCLRSVALSVLLRWLAQRCTRVGNLQACGSEVSRVGGISEWTCYINHDPPPVGMVSTRPVGMVSTWPVEVPWPVQQPWLHVKMYQGLAR